EKLARDVEPGNLEMPGAGAAREVRDPRAGDPEPPPPGGVPERCPSAVRGGRLEGQGDRADPGQSLSGGRAGLSPPRRGHHRGLGEGKNVVIVGRAKREARARAFRVMAGTLRFARPTMFPSHTNPRSGFRSRTPRPSGPKS